MPISVGDVLFTMALKDEEFRAGLLATEGRTTASVKNMQTQFQTLSDSVDKAEQSLNKGAGGAETLLDVLSGANIQTATSATKGLQSATDGLTDSLRGSSGQLGMLLNQMSGGALSARMLSSVFGVMAGGGLLTGVIALGTGIVQLAKISDEKSKQMEEDWKKVNAQWKDLAKSVDTFSSKLSEINTRANIALGRPNPFTYTPPDEAARKPAMTLQELYGPNTELQKQLHDSLLDSIRKEASAYEYAQTAAGKYGLTLDDVTKYLTSQGRSVDEIAATYKKYGQDVNVVAKGLGIDLQSVADASGKLRAGMVADVEEVTAAARQSAMDRVAAEQDAIDESLRIESGMHTARIKYLDEEYAAQLRNIDAQLGLVMTGYQSQLDAIDKQISDEDRARRDKDNADRVASLKLQIGNEKDAKKRQELQKELSQLLTGIQEDKDRQELTDQRDQIRKLMELAQQQATEAKKITQDDYQLQKDIEQRKYDDFVSDANARKVRLDQDLKDELKRYADDLRAFSKLGEDKLDSTADFVRRYNALMAQITPSVTTSVSIVTVGGTSGGGNGGLGGGSGGVAPPRPPGVADPYPFKCLIDGAQFSTAAALNAHNLAFHTSPFPAQPVQGFANGGWINEPTLLTSLSTLRPYAIAGERGPERVGGGYATANIYFEVDGRTLVRVLGQPLVDELRLRNGIRGG